jgi:hypothetical protein
MAINKDARKMMESMLSPESVEQAHKEAQKELKRLRNPFVKICNWFLTFIHGETKIFNYGVYDDHFDIIPVLSVYVHSHNYEDNKLWHFHISVQWIKWYFELQFGKDYADN